MSIFVVYLYNKMRDIPRDKKTKVMKILKTKKRTYQVIENDNGTVTLFDEFGKKDNNAGAIIGNYGGLDKFKKILIDVEIDDFEKYLRENNLHPEQRRAKRDTAHEINLKVATKKIAELEEKAKKADSAKEMFSIFQEITRISQNYNFDRGWSDADFFFLADNVLSKFLLEKLGSYTATPYDNGEMIIKTKKGVSYSTKRHPGKKSLYELIK